jgi:hypothetical protein
VNRDPDERAQPDGAARDEFDAIVALWRREGHVPQWPDGAPDKASDDSPDEPPDDGTAPAGLDVPAPSSPPAVAPQARSPDESPPVAEPAVPSDDEHFVPPDPPPLPRLGPPALVGLTLIVLGLVLVITPGWLGIADPYGLPLGLVGLAAGLGWLVLRLWPDPPDRDDDGDDDGAVV